MGRVRLAIIYWSCLAVLLHALTGCTKLLVQPFEIKDNGFTTTVRQDGTWSYSRPIPRCLVPSPLGPDTLTIEGGAVPRTQMNQSLLSAIGTFAIGLTETVFKF